MFDKTTGRVTYIRRGHAESTLWSHQRDTPGYRLVKILHVSSLQGEIHAYEALTDVCRQVTNGREEDLDIGAGDELRVHSSGVLEERAAKKSLGSTNEIMSAVALNHISEST